MKGGINNFEIGSLCALSGSPILDNISVVEKTVIGAIFVPAGISH